MRAVIGVLCGLCVCVAVGCGGSSGPAAAPLFPVTGTLKVGGQPLENIIVQLTPVDATSNRKPGVGTTDKEGKFKISTNGDRGAAAGEFKVSLTGGSSGGTTQMMPESGGEGASKAQAEMATKMQADFMKTRGPVPQKKLFPKEWADPASSPKTFEVKSSGTNDLNIDI